jgi:hypothetical protein
MAEKLAKALESNKTLKYLDLSSNYIGDEGIKHIMEVLETNRVLQYVKLNYNEITNTGANYILSALQTNNTLRGFFWDDLDYDKISEEMYEKIDEKALQNTRKQAAQDFLASSGYGIKVRPSLRYYNNVLLEDLVALMPFKTFEQKLAVARYFVQEAEINFRASCARKRTSIYCGDIADNFRAEEDKQVQSASSAMSL